MAKPKEQGYVYPNFVCRLGGEEVNKFQSTSSNILNRLSEQLIQLNNKIEICKLEISDFLFRLVSEVETKSQRNKILKIRRDIFNSKNISEEKLSFVIEFLNDSEKEKLIEYSFLHKEFENCCAEIIKSYPEESVNSRKKFIELLNNPAFQKGLLISSKPLFESQKYYTNSNGNSNDRKVEQIERGLIRYYSRMVMKATPFSTFCNIIPGYITKSNGFKGMNLIGNPDEHKSLLLLNKGLYGNLIKILQEREKVKKEIDLKLNPTFRFENDQLNFLTSIESREVFQKMNNNPVLDMIKDLIGEGKSIKYKKLVSTLIEKEIVDATEEDIIEYLDKLIEIGFLHFKFGIPDQDLNWPILLRDFLKDIDDEGAQFCYNLLKDLLELLEEYSNSEVNDRHRIISAMEDTIESTFEKMNVDIEFRSELPLYEDATSDLKINVNSNEFSSLSEKLINLIKITNRLSWPRSEKHTMRHFYDDFYGEEIESVPLLKFYEDFYREHYKEHSELIELSKNRNANADKEKLKNYNVANPFNLKVNQEITDAHKKISELIRLKWEKEISSEQINITAAEVEECISAVPEIKDEPKSFSVFSQFVLDENKNLDKLIVPNGSYLNGYGKYFSRFIRLFGEEEQKKIRETNSEFSENILAEISGDANFNANLHPPIMDWEISYPVGESGLSEKTIYTTDLEVIRKPDDTNSLILFHTPTKKYLYPIDLGFLNPMMRPPLYQLMSKFSTSSNFAFRIPDTYKEVIPQKKSDENDKVNDNTKVEEQNNVKEKPEVVCVPRISFEEDIIFSRRKWKIPASLFLKTENGETDAEYMIKLSKWRSLYNIPDEVYIRIQPLPSQKQLSKKEDEKPKDEIKTVDENSEETKVNNITKEDSSADDKAVKSELKENSDENKEEQKGENNSQKKNIKKQKFSRDFQKPQYVDFNNPLLVNLFKKLTVNLENFFIIMEERYPGRDKLPEIDGKAFSSETIFQVNIPSEVTIEEDIMKEELINEYQ